MNRISLISAISLLVAACGGSPDPEVQSPREDGADSAARSGPSPSEPGEPFFQQVRSDFFAGLRGDGEAFERAMALCEDTLADDPDHPEALVWHGAGLVAQAGTAFEQGDQQRGMSLWTRGLEEMNRAVELAPDSVAVRIPRGATLLTTSRFVPDHMAEPLIAQGVDDYQHAYELQADHFDSLSLHARGQLLYGLADGWERLGEDERAEAFYRQLRAQSEESPYRERAEAWLAEEPLPPQTEENCGACHD